MEEIRISPDEMNSTAPLNKKRKSQNEPQGSPLLKHVCCDQAPKSDSLSDRESANDSNTLQCDMDSTMSNDIESSKSGSLAVSSSTCTGQLDSSLDQHEPQNLEYDCSCSEYMNDDFENCGYSEIENLLYPNGINPNNYVLSSGRWPVNQDTQQESKKPTIDKEFEQYFSMLLL